MGPCSNHALTTYISSGMTAAHASTQCMNQQQRHEQKKMMKKACVSVRMLACCSMGTARQQAYA